ncbi:hypothetical protein CEXT_13641 [Caerostris extrusa]|uniref:Uncharacterized protein n=1 Tax=Caerostris extrusa TaxID=172846 RepID=A0AAV4YAI6_CAEEX|nr:hypothetical protein CEXT_13641 [Caerostris extrusa]
MVNGDTSQDKCPPSQKTKEWRRGTRAHCPRENNRFGKYPHSFPPKIQNSASRKINKEKCLQDMDRNRFGKKPACLIYIILLFDLQKICAVVPLPEKPNWRVKMPSVEKFPSIREEGRGIMIIEKKILMNLVMCSN